MRYHRAVSGPDLSAPFRVLEGMVVIYLARDRSIVIPAGGAWPGLPFLPEPLAAHLIPTSAMVIPGTRTGPSDDQDREAAVALVLAQALIGVGLFTTLTGDVSTISSAGAVALAAAIRRTTSFVYNETPGGAVNGSNTAFTLASVPATGTLQVYYNGALQFPGSGNDYTLSGGTITMLTAPESGTRLVASYQV